MVKIRLSRGGTKKRPFYHIVVTDSRNARDGRNIENIGYFNPIASGQDVRIHINTERANYWRSVGAQPSERVLHLMKELSEQSTN
jgi:small subunit ribosomal protein S16